jgi:NADPH:quinone reductase
VAAFHEMVHPHGSYAEYANAFAYTTWHLPKHTTFEEAATIPLAGMTAALGMYQRLKLPVPWCPATQEIPLVVYGAASAVGAYAVKMAVLSNIHPLICVAGRGVPYVESLIDKSKGDTVIDYREGDAAVVAGLQKALGGKKLLHAYDAVSEFGSYQNICKVLDHHQGKITNVLPGKKYKEIPATVERSTTQVGNVHNKDSPLDVEFGAVFFKWFGRGLEKGFFRGHPHEVIPGGLGGVQQGLQNLKDGKASATKYVFRIAETKGLDGAKL